MQPRIGLLVPYVSFYEGIVALRREKEAFAAELEQHLSKDFHVVADGLTDNEESASRAGDLFREASVHAIVVVPAVAAFGALGWAALKAHNVPVCLWNLQPSAGIPSRYDIGELIRNSGGLGVQALANTLAREGRVYRTFFSSFGPAVPAELLAFVRACCLAQMLRNATFGRIGSVFPQMTDVGMDATSWTRATGSRVVEVSPEELESKYRAQREDIVEQRLREICNRHAVANISADEMFRSARLSLALDAIVADHRLDGGAFNCHGANCLRHPEIGVTACYGVSRQTSLGRPFSCTGDLPTAIALFLMKQLAGAAIYGELDLVDESEDLVVLANGGEGDFSCAEGVVELIGNENFSGLHGRGASPKMRLSAGQATIVSFTPIDHSGSFRIVAAEGELVDRPIDGLGVFQATFRVPGVGARRLFERWCDAGAVHHLALGPGWWSEDLRVVAELMGFEFIDIGGQDAARK